jgi:IMP cyclohydrolase
MKKRGLCSMTVAREIAHSNFNTYIKSQSYPGRGLIVGRSEDAASWLILYWLMGRSDNSRNRRFVVEGSTLRTEPVDVSRLVDPSLIIYEAMLELPGIYLVSNGDQTRTIHDTIQAGGSFEQALETREREPDAPNYTPRISAMIDLHAQSAAFALSILKANLADPALTDRTVFKPALPAPGLGYCLTTYQGNSSPLPSFQGDPLLLPCRGSAEELLETYWDGLNVDNRISLAIKEIPVDGGASRLIIKNRFA